MYYIVKSDRAQTVTGLGVFAEGEERKVTFEEGQGFRTIMGLPLQDGNVPEGVTVELVAEGKEDE